MIFLLKALFFLHILSLIVGAGANVIMGLVLARMPVTPAAQKPALMGLAKSIGQYGLWGLGGLVATGLIMAGIGGATGLIYLHSWWFVLKLVFVALLVLLNVLRFNLLKNMAPKRFVLTARWLIVAILVCSIASFH
ncbi:hypothetical protein [Celeribacter persicus]|jgi:hypothetical protein|uniref:Uncharacterized protein n=1 Tax=Celeribacter persicus TaxID=1651082 RepID=A0A2T5HVP4_9RHOB|nr:hypothetical protein [Celeribacter persicus]PTQ75652.1 hypothetical protein C8N42_101191 [Celeribacter persicus]